MFDLPDVYRQSSAQFTTTDHDHEYEYECDYDFQRLTPFYVIYEVPVKQRSPGGHNEIRFT